MNKNDKFHQDVQNVSPEINDEALDNVSGGANAQHAIICTYCGKDDSFGYYNGMLFCTRCSRYYVDVHPW